MKILVAHDGSEHADKALAKGLALADKCGADLAVLHVIPELCLSSEEISAQDCDIVAGSLMAEAKGRMAKVEEGLKAAGVSASVTIVGGRPVDVIAEASKAADLLVLGSRGRHGAARILLGSVSAKAAEYAACDVLIVKS